MDTNNNLSQDIPVILQQLTKLLAKWLFLQLSAIESDWWEQMVLPKLSYQQTQLIDSRQINSLDKMDLAALLRIVDGNWYTLADKNPLGYDAKNYLKELQSIRNKWAHLDGNGASEDDAFRALDTVIRFAERLDMDSSFIEELKYKRETFWIPEEIVSKQDNLESPVSGVSNTTESVSTIKEKTSGGFELGAIVSLKSNHAQIGVICQIYTQKPENRYQVFINGQKSIFYESQLDVQQKNDSRELLPIDEINEYITSILLRHPSTEILYSMNAARIDFVPYQFRPVLKFLHSDRPRLLIADGVGVGKTIEAGLILRELEARDAASSVLIICPKALVDERKWETELRRFDERFEVLNGERLRYCIGECNCDGEWPVKHSKIIIPYSLLDERFMFGRGTNEIGYTMLDKRPHWDLVIVDEAHHIRNSTTQGHEAVQAICDNADAVVFLTATPIQTDNQDLFNLLRILRPDMVIDQTSFLHIMEPNQHINDAINAVRKQDVNWKENAIDALDHAAATDYGQFFYPTNELFVRVTKRIQSEEITCESRVELLSDLEQLHTLHDLISRTRRKDIGDFTVRNSLTVEVSFTPEQKQLYESLLEFEKRTLQLLHEDSNISFMMSTLKRQAASCIFGLAPLLNDIINRRMSVLEDICTENEIDFSNSLGASIMPLVEDMKHLAQESICNDTKYDALIKIIKEKQRSGNKKLMIFSSFRHTLAYLLERLKKEGFRAEVIHGGVSTEDRRAIRNRFELKQDKPNTIDVLLFSEVGCEGLDYQFCDTMVNYDLPWNPMRIEQRIGRIDRRGQKSEKVLIYNLITSDTIDAVIYERCLKRIGVFEHSIGECDAILGEIQKSIDQIVADTSLTMAEQEQKIQQLMDNEIREINERNKLEDESCELLGIQIQESLLNNELSKADSFWLRPTALFNLVCSYIREIGANPDYAIQGSGDIKTLRLSLETRLKIHDHFKKIHHLQQETAHRFDRFLKGTESSCRITFSSEAAKDNPDCFLITPVHPLVILAANNLSSEKTPYTIIRVSSDEIESGEYPFVIYSWEYCGMRKELKIMPVCENETIRNALFDIIENGNYVNEKDLLPSQERFDSLDQIQYNLWLSAKKEYQLQAENLFARKSSTLNASYNARIAICDEQIANSSNDKYRSMRLGQKRNLEEDRKDKLGRLHEEKLTSDITSKPIVYGLLLVDFHNRNWEEQK